MAEFVVGKPAKNKNFIGRTACLERIWKDERSCWVIGSRRIGKTSLLMHIEEQTDRRSSKYIGLYISLYKKKNFDSIKSELLDNLESRNTKSTYFASFKIDENELLDKNLFEIIQIIKKKIREATNNKKKLLLLLDESDELITLEKSEGYDNLYKFKKLAIGNNGCRSVISSSKALLNLDYKFIEDLVPPHYLSNFTESDAEVLITKLENLNLDQRSEIKEKTNNHPFLLQLLCYNIQYYKDVEAAINHVENDESILHFFQEDFRNQSKIEQLILFECAKNGAVTLNQLLPRIGVSETRLSRLLFNLCQLGYLRRHRENYCIGNYFFNIWLQDENILEENKSRLDNNYDEKIKEEKVMDPLSISIATNLGVKFFEKGIDFLIEEAKRILEIRRSRVEGNKVSKGVTVTGELPDIVKDHPNRNIKITLDEIVQKDIESLLNQIESHKDRINAFSERKAIYGMQDDPSTKILITKEKESLLKVSLELKKKLEKIYGEKITIEEFNN